MNTYIFDFDGTLADSKQCSVLATQHAFHELKLVIPSIETIEYYMGIPIEQSFKEMAKESLDNPTFEQLLATFREAYRSLEEKTLTLFPQMKDVLSELNSQGKNCFVLSSKKTNVLLRNIETLGIDRYFKDCIGSDQVQYYKPHPAGILQLTDRYQLNVKECIMIGDAIFDIQMGHAAGTMTCAVTWGSHSKEKLLQEKPTFCIDEVPSLLRLNHLS